MKNGQLVGLVALVFCVINVRADDFDVLRTKDPNKQTIVHLFEWKWKDVANECETFLSKYGYGAVQISVPHEHIQGGAWWTRYQPVSYKLESRSGNRNEFIDMVNRCNAVGVRIIADVVTNHMVGVGGKGTGTGGTYFDGSDGVEQFPGVPFGPNDFNDKYCHGDISGSDYNNNADHVRRCRLSGLLDLNHDTDYVRGKIAGLFNDLLNIGVAGIRMDAAKHMYPGNIQNMVDRANNLKSDIYGNGHKMFNVMEVIDHGGESVKADEYVNFGRVTNFKYGSDVTAAVRRQKNFKYLWNFGEAWGYWRSNDVVTFIDDHDTQRDNNHDIETYKDGSSYQLAVGFMLSQSYGIPRVLSGYAFSGHDQGPPGGSPQFNSDGTCKTDASGWVCEHRWPATRRMTLWRSQCFNANPTNFYNTTDNCLAFAKQGKGFFALNNGFNDWSFTASTTMPGGQYCDIYWSDAGVSGCNGHTVNVDGNGNAHITVQKGKFLAIHV